MDRGMWRQKVAPHIEESCRTGRQIGLGADVRQPLPCACPRTHRTAAPLARHTGMPSRYWRSVPAALRTRLNRRSRQSGLPRGRQGRELSGNGTGTVRAYVAGYAGGAGGGRAGTGDDGGRSAPLHGGVISDRGSTGCPCCAACRRLSAALRPPTWPAWCTKRSNLPTFRCG